MAVGPVPRHHRLELPGLFASHLRHEIAMRNQRRRAAGLICRTFEAHLIYYDLPLAKAGGSILTRITMMAMSTSNSIRVKALSFRRFIACPGATSAR